MFLCELQPPFQKCAIWAVMAHNKWAWHTLMAQLKDELGGDHIKIAGSSQSSAAAVGKGVPRSLWLIMASTSRRIWSGSRWGKSLAWTSGRLVHSQNAFSSS